MFKLTFLFKDHKETRYATTLLGAIRWENYYRKVKAGYVMQFIEAIQEGA